MSEFYLAIATTHTREMLSTWVGSRLVKMSSQARKLGSKADYDHTCWVNAWSLFNKSKN